MSLPNEWLTDESWYKNSIEKPIREIVKNLRNNGINTFCSCGHGLYIQCETYDPSSDIDTIFNILVTMGIKKYRVAVIAEYDDELDYHKFLEIQLTDKNGNYYETSSDNPDFEQQTWED